MTVLKDIDPGSPSDPKRRAGRRAEEQMAFYLRRAFDAEENIFVINDLRLEDPRQPNADGTPGVCQIDHLLLHRWGVFIVESKSVSDEVEVRDDGTGGDEWVRIYRGKRSGMPSPLRQAILQGELLRGFLNQQAGSLLGKMPVGLRTLNTLVNGSAWKDFRAMPVQVCVAISESGSIKRVRNWREPKRRWRDFVKKAENVPEAIRSEWKRHADNGPMINRNVIRGEADPDYGVWSMTTHEYVRTAKLLVSAHTPRRPAAVAEHAPVRSAQSKRAYVQTDRPASAPAKCEVGATGDTHAGNHAVCRHCQSTNLSACSGRYGYYLKCADCGGNTPMASACPACKAPKQEVKVSKDGDVYTATCRACGALWVVWREPAHSA